MSACVPTTTAACPDRESRERAFARRSAFSEPVSSVTPIPSGSQQRADGLEVLAGEEVGRGQQGALEPGPRDGRERIRRDRGLARADVALEEPEHRGLPREVRPDLRRGGRLVVGQRRPRARPGPPARR